MQAGYKYALVFLGLTTAGDFFLAPLVYSTKFGFIKIPELFLLVAISEALSDTVWYVAGRVIREDRLHKLPFVRHKPHMVERTSAFFRARDAKILFASKFVYGTRIVTQILCGAHRMRFLPYLAINIFGMLVWTVALFGLVSVVHFSIGSFESTARKIQVGLLLLVVGVAGLSFILKRLVGKRWIGE